MVAKPSVKIRRPPSSPSPELAAREAFASKKRSDAQTSERSAAVVERRDGRQLRRMTVYLPDELARTLAVYCAEHDCDRSALVADAVRARLGA